MNKKQSIFRIFLYSLIISISSVLGDRLFHFLIFETIQGKPTSTMPYYLLKLIIVFIISFIILMFKKLNIWIKSISVGIIGALLFTFALKMFYSGIYGSGIIDYGYLLHASHGILFFMFTYLTIKVGDKIG